MAYAYSKSLDTDFDTAKERVVEALKQQGFGVLSEIDVQATLKKKLDVDFYKYLILGACNPQLAFEALKTEDKIGTMLPCNVILQQKDDTAPIEISAVDPVASMSAIENKDLEKIATEVQKRLKQVIDTL